MGLADRRRTRIGERPDALEQVDALGGEARRCDLARPLADDLGDMIADPPEADLGGLPEDAERGAGAARRSLVRSRRQGAERQSAVGVRSSRRSCDW